jgi:ATP-dependent helicase/nuclease subunit B
MTAATLFHAPGPRVFAVAPGVDFAQALAAGLRTRLAAAPAEAIARVSLTVNANRAARAVALAFEGDGAAAYLPRIATLDDIVADPRLDVPLAIETGRRALTLIRLVTRFLEARPDLGPAAAAPALAAALGALMDETAREGVDLAALDEAAPPEHARHWETTLAFLQIVRQAWPQVLAQDEGGAVDPERRRRLATEALLAAWAADPPAHPVIAAGSTGSRAVTADYLRAVARLPQGAVVLPGFDPALAAEVWDSIGDEHPWAGTRRLIDGLGLTPDAVGWWTDDAPANRPRRRLIAQALRPAPVTDRWRQALPALRAEIAAASDGLTILEAPDPRREAAAIALALRQAIETPGARAALITPDRGLARRVAAQLARWGVEPDDSGGRPLALTPPGVFLRLVADAAFARFDAVALLSLMKHPLAMAGPRREAHLRAARAYEIAVLRRRPDLNSLAAAAQAVTDADNPLHAFFAPLLALQSAPCDLKSMADAHLATAEALAGPALWEKAAGEAVGEAATRFAAAAVVFGPCPAPRYPPIFAAAMTGEAREDAFRPDPRVMIWGPLEARMQSADLIVLGGLNEGAWPAAPSPDPWLSRPMRARVGLPLPEGRIGLGAHDVLTAACAPQVVLTRAERSGGAPTTRSRWLERLMTLCRGVDKTALDAMLDRGAALVALADLLDRPAAPTPRAARPAPRPPVAHRPDRLSATQVETLIRDPYAIYARHVLRLKALDPVGRALDARDRGNALHKVLEALAANAADGAPLDEALARALDDELAKAPAGETQRRLWRARIRRAAPALLKGEAARQALGAPRVEVQGSRAGGGFTLTARADRIDLRDGAVAIYDYKTGSAPTDKQIQAFAKQLPLEAAIAEAGGFVDIPPARIVELAHIVLGGDAAGTTRPLKGDPEALAADAWTGLMRLVAAYADPAIGYPARARPRHIAHDGDYDHLSRYGEWEDGDAADNDPREAPA